VHQDCEQYRVWLGSVFLRSESRPCLADDGSVEFGIIGLNSGAVSTEVAPFGGMKQSGIGREGGREGLLEFTELKYVCIGGI